MSTHILPRALLSLAVLAGGLCLSPQAAPQADSCPFPTPSAGMTIEGREGAEPIMLEGLLLEFGERTGEHLIWTDDTGSVLEAVRVALDRQLVIPAEELYSVVESILVTNRFVLVDLGREEPRMMAVYSLDSPARAHLLGHATYVSAEDLPLYADHPAILISTVVRLPRMNVVTLEKAMRRMIADPTTMRLVPAPATNQLILTGPGADVVQLAAMLRELKKRPAGSVTEPELLPLAEPLAPFPATPELLLEASEHQYLGALIGECVEAYVNRAGRRDAEAELREALEKLRPEATPGRDPLSLTADLGAALWYARDHAKATGIEKGRVADFELAIPFYGTEEEPFLTRYELWAPSGYAASAGPYPLILCIPDVGRSPEDELNDNWADGELRDGTIVLCLEMPEKTENWSEIGGRGNPDGIGILLSVLADVRKRYAIDFDRVFIAGRGAGVKAAMEIAGAFPDRFAGVIGRAGDAAELPSDNLSNLPCFFAGAGGNATRFAEKAMELGMVQPVLSPDSGERDILAWIQATRRRSNPEEVILLAGNPMPNRAYWLEIPAHDGQSVARITAKADRSSNTIEIQAEGITSVTLLLNDVLVDLDRDVRVLVNGVEHEQRIPRSFNTMMEQIYRGRSDPGKLYTAVKRFEIPAVE